MIFKCFSKPGVGWVRVTDRQQRQKIAERTQKLQTKQNLLFANIWSHKVW